MVVSPWEAHLYLNFCVSTGSHPYREAFAFAFLLGGAFVFELLCPYWEAHWRRIWSASLMGGAFGFELLPPLLGRAFVFELLCPYILEGALGFEL